MSTPKLLLKWSPGALAAVLYIIALAALYKFTNKYMPIIFGCGWSHCRAIPVRLAAKVAHRRELDNGVFCSIE
jgi:hypothetical protein